MDQVLFEVVFLRFKYSSVVNANNSQYNIDTFVFPEAVWGTC